ncbi:MAG: alpha/beta hydrolase [Anaerolineae bacterium]|nr:MAG: alpha/beta hydrolase [Anaerolineae bacterium]
MSPSRLMRILGITVILSLFLTSCGGQQATPTTAPPAGANPALTQPAGPPPSGSPGELQITFTADRAQIAPGECATLQWQVSGGFAVFLEDEQVEAQGSQQVCPGESRPYFLRVDMGDHMEERQVDIQVGGEPVEGPPPQGEGEAPPPVGETPPEGEIPPQDEIPAIGVLPGPSTPPTAANVPYLTVEGETLTLNVYHPAGEENVPVVLYIHGGGFTSFNKWEGQHWASYLLPWGYAVVSIDYRLAPEHPFPAAIADVQCAIAWVRQHAAEYHLDAQHLAVAGSSAGGHLAALAGMAGASTAPPLPWQPSCGAGSNLQVQAVVSHSGPMDLKKIVSTPEGREAVVAFVGSACEDPAPCDRASPITYVSSGAPPVLLFHGAADDVVPVVNARDMQAALQQAGVPVTYVEVQGAGHVFPLEGGQMQTLRQFLDRYLTGH